LGFGDTETALILIVVVPPSGIGFIEFLFAEQSAFAGAEEDGGGEEPGEGFQTLLHKPMNWNTFNGPGWVLLHARSNPEDELRI
jgi:hypothetical protein